MPDRRVVRADHHAIPLITDIIESTAFLYPEITTFLETAGLSPNPEKVIALLDGGECLIGFEDHFPFGFVAMRKRSDCCQLAALFLYRDYLGRGYGDYLLDRFFEWTSELQRILSFALVPRKLTGIVSFLSGRGFEEISPEPEEIHRWRDGLLAEEIIGPGTVLMVYLQETSV